MRQQPTPWRITGSLRFVSRGFFRQRSVLQVQERRYEPRESGSEHRILVWRWRDATSEEAAQIDMSFSSAVLRRSTGTA